MFTKGQRITLVVFAVALGLMVAGCAPSAPTTTAIVAGAAESFNAGDLEKSLGYFADDAVYKLVGVPPGEKDTYAGKEELRAWFKGLAQVHFRIEVQVIKAEKDTVITRTQTWMDPTKQLGVAPLVAIENYVVQNGKIKNAVWTITPDSAAKLQSATSGVPAKPVVAMNGFPTGVFTSGAWVCGFNGDASYICQGEGTHGGITSGQGFYAVIGNQVVLADAGCADPGTYNWSLGDNQLKLKVDDERCAYRQTIMDNSIWSKKP